MSDKPDDPTQTFYYWCWCGNRVIVEFGREIPHGCPGDKDGAW